MAKIDDLIKELRDAIKDPKDAKKASLAFNRLAKTQIAQMAGIEIKCPVCGSTEHVKNGEGRFKCKKCGKKYRPATNTILEGYDFTFDEWIKNIDMVCNGRECAKFSASVGVQISERKAWLLKMKILSAFANMPQPVLTGIVQVDGTYFRESQKGNKDPISFVYKGKTRPPREKYYPSVCGIYGKEFICCISGLDNNGHVFAKCVSLGTPTYDQIKEILDKQVSSPKYLCTDNHPLYEQYCDERLIQHHITPSTYRNDKYLAGFIEKSDKYHPNDLDDKEKEFNERLLKRMYEERSGPHIRNSGKMSYEAYKILVNEKNEKYFDIESGINQVHGNLKNALVNGKKNVGSQYLDAYIALEVYKENFKVDYEHPLGSGLDDYKIVFAEVLKYYDYKKFKELIDTKTLPLEYNSKTNTEIKKRISGGRNLVALKRNAFDGWSQELEMPDIFNKRNCFRNMSAHRINYLCRYFGIRAEGMSKSQKCDALKDLPNADEIIFREIYLLYYASKEEVLQAVNEGFFENKNKNKKKGRRANPIKTLQSEGLYSKSEINLLKKKTKIIFDTETTGLKDNDELLSLTIIDGNSNVLFNEMFKPEKRKSWSDAEKINGITPEMVKDKKLFKDYKVQIQTIFNTHELLIGYNIKFDISMLTRQGIVVDGKRTFDVMLEYSRLFGNAKWHKLKHCAEYYKYDWTNAQHTSLGDTEATLFCFNEMCK